MYKLYNLPTSLEDSPQVLLAMYRGEEIPVLETVHAALHFVSFGLGQIHQHDANEFKATGGFKNVKPATEEEFKAVLESLCDSSKKQDVGAIDWKSLLLLGVQLLLKLLTQG